VSLLTKRLSTTHVFTTSALPEARATRVTSHMSGSDGKVHSPPTVPVGRVACISASGMAQWTRTPRVADSGLSGGSFSAISELKGAVALAA
jgi:hypothetical protein